VGGGEGGREADGRGSAFTAPLKDVLDGSGGERDPPYDLLSCPHIALQGLVFWVFAIPKAHSGAAGGQDALHGASVEGGEDGQW